MTIWLRIPPRVHRSPDARPLKMQTNKSDRIEGAGIARITQIGWFKELRLKDINSHSVRARLARRGLLAQTNRDLENQIRGLLKKLWSRRRSCEVPYSC